jgi:hypothetical protein
MELIMKRMGSLEVMKRSSFIKVDAKMIMKLDLSGLDHPMHVERVVDYLIGIVERMPKQSVVGLVDFRDIVMSEESTQHLFRLVERAAPYFRASAFLENGGDSLKMAETVSKRFDVAKLPVYQDEDLAVQWLFSH